MRLSQMMPLTINNMYGILTQAPHLFSENTLCVIDMVTLANTFQLSR